MTRPNRSLPANPPAAIPCAAADVPRIAVDLLGGDGAPAVVVDGALQACSADPDLHLLLVGPKNLADEVIGSLGADLRRRVVPAFADRVVGMSDPPMAAVRPSTTVHTAVRALVSGSAHALVSAGASAAAVTAATHGLGRFLGVRRPAMAAILPALAGPVVLLDVGAITDSQPVDLKWNAVLGAAFAQIVGNIQEPRVGLLSIGSERGKGDRLRRILDAELPRLVLPAQGRYVGLVEGYDVARGELADVVVTDGFTGNVLLKGMEGAYALAGAGRTGTVGVPRAATLLGVDGTVVVCHGAAGGMDIAAGIGLAARLYRLQASARLSAVARTSSVEAR